MFGVCVSVRCASVSLLLDTCNEVHSFLPQGDVILNDFYYLIIHVDPSDSPMNRVWVNAQWRK